MKELIEQLKHISGFERYEDKTNGAELGFSDFLEGGFSLLDISSCRSVESVVELLVKETGAVDFDINHYGTLKARVKSSIENKIAYFYYLEMAVNVGRSFDLDDLKKEGMIFISEDMYLNNSGKVMVRAVFVSAVRYDISRLPN